MTADVSRPWRHERKFRISPAQHAAAARWCRRALAPDPHAGPGGVYFIRSVYLDSVFGDDQADKAAGALARRKIRLRAYSERPETVHLERKAKFGIRRIHSQTPRMRALNRRKLQVIERQILAQVPGSAVASDQPYREYDLAIDYCEDVKRLSRKSVRHIVEIFHAHGAQAKVSSIHVNGWFGDFDKLAMARRYIHDIDGVDLDAEASEYAFIGDSPNDEPMFAAFPMSVGVANVRRFLPRMTAHPTWITTAEGGVGFAELVDAILSNA